MKRDTEEMNTIKEESIESYKRISEKKREVKILQAEIKFIDIFGDAKYEIEKDGNIIIIKSEGVVFDCEYDENKDMTLWLAIICPFCKKVYSQPIKSASEFGDKLESEGYCECGKSVGLLQTDNALMLIKKQKKIYFQRDGETVKII